MSGVGIGLVGLAAGAVAGFYAARSRLVSDLTLLASPSPKVGGIIDTHHHFLPDFYLDAIGRSSIAALTPTHEAPTWSSEDDLAVLDNNNIRKAVLSAPIGTQQKTAEKTALLATRLNEFSASLVHTRPDRYSHFAILPLPDIDASLKEATHGLDSLGAVGLVVSTNYDGAYLGDPKFEDLWPELNRRKAIIFVHPTTPETMPTGVPPGILEFVFDTTRTVTSLLYAGVTSRYPDIRFLFSHGGGTVPFIWTRIDGATRMDKTIAQMLPNGALPELQKMYWDSALAFGDGSMKCLLTMTCASQVSFGSDYPFAPKIIFPIALKSLKQELSHDDLTAVLNGSALRMMPGLA